MTVGGGDANRGVLDDAVLDELREDMEDEFGEVVEAFLDEVPGWLDSLTAALGKEDAEGVFQAAHAMKSSSGYMGATAMGHLAAQLERSGRERNLDGSDAMFAELCAEWAVVEPKLRALAGG
jgi:HPt (histidine-containing phosphotransfer) domain-containing protein